jgi:tRNA-Thr(GGU) m(6)t(6)A37 methyltransferase TsaA
MAGYAIEIDEQYRPALAELRGFGHINVLWWCHHLDESVYRNETVTVKPYRHGPEQVGIFATRSPLRPNPIALTTTRLLDVDLPAGVLTVAYLDADDGTPVLDIKPYLPGTDRVRDVTTPLWCSDWPQWLEDSASFDWASVFGNAQ